MAKCYVAEVFTYIITGEAASIATFQILVGEAQNYSRTLKGLLSFEVREKIEERMTQAANQIKEGTFVPTSVSQSSPTQSD